MVDRVRAAIGWSGAVVLALGLGWWCGRATFEPPHPDAAAATASPETYTVEVGEVGRDLTTTATVTWPLQPIGSGGSTGTVTSVAVQAGAEVEPGDVLYTVDLRPVVVAEGAVPAFRDLVVGDQGADVRQLQGLLRAVGATGAAPTGTFTAATAVAVKAWQRDLGVKATGSVQRGDVVFVPSLPARVVLGDEVRVGAALAPGSTVVSAVPAEPDVEIRLDTSQRAAIPPTGAAVTVDGPDGPWAAVVADESSDDGAAVLRLTAADGGAVCGTTCGTLPFTTAGLRFPAAVALTPHVKGALVPLATLGAAPDGSAYVVAADGSRTPVTVRATDGSRAVVEGVRAGDVVALFAGAPATGAGSAPGASAEPTP